MSSSMTVKTTESGFAPPHGWLQRGGVVIRLSQEQIQEHVLAALPVKGSFGPTTYIVSSATVSLLASGRVRIDTRVEAEAGGVGIETEIHASSGIRYEEGAFYLSDFSFDQVDVVSPDKAEEKPSLALGAIGSFAAAAARVGVARTAAAAVKLALEKVPIYRIPGDGMMASAARLSLQGVSVEDRSLLVHLDPLRALGQAAAGIAASALIVTVAVLGGFWAMHGFAGH